MPDPALTRPPINELIEPVSPFQELLALYERTLQDRHFSRGEKRAIVSASQGVRWDASRVGLLRNRLFALAKSRVHKNGGHKTLDWLNEALKTIPAAKTTAARTRVYFSPGDDCLRALLTLLRSARGQLDVCVFTITDDRVTEALREAARRGVSVRVITDNDKAHDVGSDIFALARTPVSVRTDRTPDHMHHKFAIVDRNTAATGSYNWTRSAARDNFENLLVTDDPAAVRSYVNEFDRLWPRMGRV